MVVEAVVRRLADARLITTEGTAKAGGEVSVEVAHEALIRGWGTLREWIDADRAGLRLQRQLTEAAREWEANGARAACLYRGSRLTAAREWSKTHRDGLNRAEAEFLERQPAQAAIGWKGCANRLAGGATLLALVVWEGFRWQRQARFASLQRSTNTAVEEARQLSLQSRWDAAIKVLQAAEGQLEPGAQDESLRRQLATALESYKKKQEERDSEERDRRLVEALDEAHMLGDATAKTSTMTSGPNHRCRLSAGVSRGRNRHRYAAAEAAAELIRAKPVGIREVLAAALDDWAWRAGPPDD